MSGLLGVALWLVTATTSVWAGSATLGAEFTLYPDGLMWHWWTSCVWPMDQAFDQGDGTHGVQCISVPGVIIGFSGTSTLKAPGTEVLAQVICNGVTLWRGEQDAVGTVAVTGTNLADAQFTGPCSLGIQSLGGLVRGGYEMQLTIYYTPSVP